MGRISMPQGRGSQMHNRRDYAKIGKPVPENIDVSKSAQNVTFVDRDLRQAYNEIFGEALREYNDKQKRADRRIDDYYDHIAKSKNGEKLFYEDVVQWGDMGDFVNSPVVAQKAKEALLEYIRTFEERNPNLKLVGAYIHMDEASPHLHLDYVPVATGYKQGMSMRNSLDRAMKEMGFAPDPKKQSKTNNATKLWKEHERKVFAEICRDHGLEVEAEIKGRGRKSLSVEEYKEAKHEMIGEIEAEVQPLRDLKVEIDNIDNISTGKALKPGHVTIKKDDFEILKQQAKAYVVNRNEIETMRDRSAQLDQRNEAMEISFTNRTKELDKREKRVQQDTEYLFQAQHDLREREYRNNHALELLTEAEAKAEVAESKYNSLHENYKLMQDWNGNLQVTIKEMEARHESEIRDAVKAATEPLNVKIKEQEIEIEARVNKAVEAAVKPLQAKIEKQEQTISNLSFFMNMLLQLVRYVRDRFAGRLSDAFLSAAIKKGEEQLARENIEVSRSARVSSLYRKDIVLDDLSYRRGDEGKGLYTSKGLFVYAADTITEAKEAFPNCTIKNELEKGLER